MTSRYDSSPSNLRALRDRLTAAAKREGVVFGRLQQHVGVLVVASEVPAHGAGEVWNARVGQAHEQVLHLQSRAGVVVDELA